MGSLIPGQGLKFDAGFDADYWIGLGGGDVGGAYRLRAHYATLPTAGGGVGRYLGETAAAGDGVLFGGDNPDGIRAAIHNGNLAGVIAGCVPGPAAGDPLGIELRIPYAALGNIGPGDCIRATMFVNGPAHDLVTNQFLAPLPSGPCSLGDPRLVDLVLRPGSQFLTKCVPTVGVAPGGGTAPASLAVRAWPNPATGDEKLRWGTPLTAVRAEVFDIGGRRVHALDSGPDAVSEIVWDGRSRSGERLPPGLYFIRVRAAAGFTRPVDFIENLIRSLRSSSL